MELFAESLTQYKRLLTREVRIGDLLLGNNNPIRLQTMTTTDTMDTMATVEQTIRCIEAGAELVRITAPSKKDAENLLNIKTELHKRGYHTPLVADIHFTPNAAEIAARIVEKVRVNPGNYVDKKKFEQIDYSDAEYAEEIERIRDRFTPLVKICKEYGTAMRIGTNHGSLSDRIMSRYGDTPIGMVESAMEFLRIARDESYHQIVLSMKASNPQVMVQAYRLLIKQMHEEFGEIYPLHLGVTEAGDGEEGRIKSAVGIGTLMEDGIGDTIRVSLTEDPEFEIPVCRDIVKRYNLQIEGKKKDESKTDTHSIIPHTVYSPFQFKRHLTIPVNNIGGGQVPVVIGDLSKIEHITPESLKCIGYTYNEADDKWNISDTAAEYMYINKPNFDFALPGTLKVIVPYDQWKLRGTGFAFERGQDKAFPIYCAEHFESIHTPASTINFVMIDCPQDEKYLDSIVAKPNVILCLSSANKNAMQTVRNTCMLLAQKKITIPIIFITNSNWQNADEHLIHYAAETGALFLDGFGDGICLGMSKEAYNNFGNTELNGRKYNVPIVTNTQTEAFLNNTAFSILQATRMRISKTEYISCPSCGRTLFDLQETTTKIRSVTHHLKGVKIAIMGCIVNGPGEMADADFGYVGSGPGKITLYKGKEVIKRNINSDVAVDELINLLKENEVWIEPQ